MNLYGKITPNFIEEPDEITKSVILYDPSDVYSRITIRKTDRRQKLHMGICFPNLQTGYCACGCGNKLLKYQRRWFDPSHNEVLYNVMKVINGDSELIRSLMMNYLPYQCAYCNKEDYTIETFGTTHNGHSYIKYSASGIHVDHIRAVKQGGGGCWLGNYQFLCHKCNLAKGKIENFVYEKPKEIIRSTLFD